MYINKDERLQTYGFKEDIEIFGTISLVCSVLGNGSKQNADLNLEKIARTESHLGNYKDDEEEYGESPFQFDRLTFHDTIRRTKEEDKKIVFKYFSIILDEIEYEDLRFNLLASTILARLKYKLVPLVFPNNDDLDGQYDYYKTYWNGKDTEDEKGGKSTKEHFLDLTKDCYFK